MPALTQNAAKPFRAFDDALGDNNSSFSKPPSVGAAVGPKTQQQHESTGSNTSGQSNSNSGSTGSSRKPHFTLGDDEAGAAQPDVAQPVEGQTAAEEKQEGDHQEETRAMTLLEWISRDEKQTSLRKMAEQCQVAMQKVNEGEIEKMRQDAVTAVNMAEQKDMKQIKGLELRLSGLEELMQEARLVVKEQSDMAKGFRQNQTRANNLGDPSILPDLCDSHEKQLNVMFLNQKKLGNIKARIYNSKKELAENLQLRLK